VKFSSIYFLVYSVNFLLQLLDILLQLLVIVIKYFIRIEAIAGNLLLISKRSIRT
jgi:hypothetical protein